MNESNKHLSIHSRFALMRRDLRPCKKNQGFYSHAARDNQMEKSHTMPERQSTALDAPIQFFTAFLRALACERKRGTSANLLNAHSAPGNAFFNVLTCVPCRAFILRGCKLPRNAAAPIYGKSIQHTPRVGGAARLCISLRQGQMGPMFLRQNAARRKREENSRGADLK
jgi:hypothetical protein